MGSIIDGFIFYNELDLLEIRLFELAPVVDKFVLVEATHTHQGREKPLYFDENKSWFEGYNIQHIVVPTKHPNSPSAEQVWDNEIFQRDCIAQGFTIFRDDIAMVSDIDEIPSRELIGSLHKIKLPVAVKQRMSYYFMNTVCSTMDWYGTVISQSPVAKEVTPQNMRNAIWDPRFPKVEGGWHFSYLGTPEFIIDKLESFTHSEFNKPEFKDPEKIRKLIGEGKDLFGRGYEFEKIDSDNYPHLVKEQPDRFKEYFA